MELRHPLRSNPRASRRFFVVSCLVCLPAKRVLTFSPQLEQHRQQHPPVICTSHQSTMCSRVCSTARCSALVARRLVHNSNSSTTGGEINNSLNPGQGSAGRIRFRSTGCISSTSTSLHQAITCHRSLRWEARPAVGSLVPRRGLSSEAQVSDAITVTKLSVEGGAMTLSLPLPGLPGLTAVSVSVDVPVRDFVKQLMSLDER